MRKKLLVLQLLLLCAVISTAQGSVLYYDNFDGPAGVDLAGTTPDITTGGATWVAGGNFGADGTVTYEGATMGDSAYLPFIPEDGYIYELSAKIDTRVSPFRNNVNDWIGLGFTQANLSPELRFFDDSGVNNNPIYWGMTRTDQCTANKDQTFIGPRTASGANTTTISADNIKIVLNTTTPTWVVSWYYDGNLERTVNVDDALKPNFQYVAISNARADGSINEFILTRQVQLQAFNPVPANGSLAYSTTVNLQWQPGVFAAKNDVYFGDSFDDVNDATTATPVIYKGRQDPNNYTVTGLVPGVAYYWRIDGVDADGVTIDRGAVWSFSVQPLTAYNPSPSDGAKYLDTNVNLVWSSGYKAKTHDIYLGTSLDDVSNASRSNQLGVLVRLNNDANSYDPGTLELGTDYYWRIDEVDGTEIFKGDVWKFSTMPVIPVINPDLLGWWKLDEGQGDRALDWSGHGNHGTLVNGPQWAQAGQIDGSLQFDGLDDYVNLPIGSVINSLTDSTFAVWVNYPNIGAPWPGIFEFGTGTDVYMYLSPRSGWGNTPMQFGITTGGSSTESQLTAPFALATDWHHLTIVIDGINKTMQLYLDGDLVVTEQVQTLPKDLGNTTQNWLGRMQSGADTYYFTGYLDDFRIYNRLLTQNDIERAMTGNPALSSKPHPANGATVDIEHVTPINWLPGEGAAHHDVYFGTDANAVENADISDTTGIYRGRQDPNNYTPLEELGPNQTYYWRIDEIDADDTISKGRLWSFTISDYLIVDDFEEYGDVSNRIFDVWADYYVNNTGMTVGHFDPPFAEQTIIHGGSQSMYMHYDNDGTVNEGTDYEQSGTLLYSETQRTWETPQNWTRKGADSLTLWFRGVPASVGSFTAGPPIVMTGAGADIWGTADQFHFAYKRLSGAGSITAKVVSLTNTHGAAKAGVMIRESLAVDSAHSTVNVTPSSGVEFLNRTASGADTTSTSAAGITAPQWVRLTRSGNNFTGEYSVNGSTWETLGSTTIPMLFDVYIGLIVCSHDVNATCTAEFSDVATTGTVTGDWQSQDIGIESNQAEQLYVAVQDSAIKSAVVKHPNPDATTIGTWTQWNIPFTDFAGVNIQAVKSLAIGVGDRANPKPGGSGTLYIDDIWLILP